MIHGAELGLAWRIIDGVTKLFKKRIILEFAVRPIKDPEAFSCDLTIRNNEDFGVTLVEVRLEKPMGAHLLRRHTILYVGGKLYDPDEAATSLFLDRYVGPSKVDRIGFAFVGGRTAERLLLTVIIRRNGVPTRTIRRKIREALSAEPWTE